MAEPLRPLLEALSAEPETKNFSGEIRSAEDLLSSEALAKLEARHAGIFAIVLVDEKIDVSVFQYLKSDSIANDTGPNVFALYEGAPKSRVVRDVKIDGLGAIRTESPVVAFARSLFPNNQIIFPGVVIAERLTGKEAVFVPLNSGVQADVTDRLRKLWGLINDSWKARTKDKPFTRALGELLALRGIPYSRSEGISVREHLTILLRALWDIRRDLLALIPVVGKAFGKKAKE
ncbi:hypothetical protein AAFX91_13300 [Bradyrhizobium sp. 31Argb]|uniref:hypothetical protein n=1 Tax=Bradyrhizobium sp. 31Argb TaxID=3141247 RepID=UPI003748651A